MSVNLTMDLRITGVPAELQDAALKAVGGVLRQHGIERDVVLGTVEGELRGVTPYPMIISRSYEWCPRVESDLAAAVAAVVPSAVPKITWDSPDQP
jgi:hypothetical protein